MTERPHFLIKRRNSPRRYEEARHTLETKGEPGDG